MIGVEGPSVPAEPENAQPYAGLDILARLAGQKAGEIATDRISHGVLVGGFFRANLAGQRLELRNEGVDAGNWRLWPSGVGGDVFDLLVFLGEVPSREDAITLAFGEGWIADDAGEADLTFGIDQRDIQRRAET